MNSSIKKTVFFVAFSTLSIAFSTLSFANDPKKLEACIKSCLQSPEVLQCKAEAGGMAEKCFKLVDVCKAKKGC